MTERAAPGDHFSGVARGYATFRPRYPKMLFEELIPLARGRRLAWDCAAGTGQATLDLAEYFERVIASDVSAAQVAQAPPHPKVAWEVARAESSGIAAHSVDFIAVAQALHWFDLEAFYAEVQRVAAVGAAIAVWSYGSVEIAGDVGAAVSRFEHETLAEYWPAERQRVLEGYASVPFPFDEVRVAPVRMMERWSRAQLLGYLRTWSGVTRYYALNGVDPVSVFAEELAVLWPDDLPRVLEWPLSVRAGRVSVLS